MRRHRFSCDRVSAISATVAVFFMYATVLLIWERFICGDYPIVCFYRDKIPLARMYPFHFLTAISGMFGLTLRVYTALSPRNRERHLCLVVPWLTLTAICCIHTGVLGRGIEKNLPQFSLILTFLLLPGSLILYLITRRWRPGQRWLEFASLYMIWLYVLTQIPYLLFYVFPYILIPLCYAFPIRGKRYATFLRYTGVFVTWISLSCLAGGATGSLIRWRGFQDMAPASGSPTGIFLQDMFDGYFYGMNPLALSLPYNIPVLLGTIYILHRSRLLDQ